MQIPFGNDNKKGHAIPIELNLRENALRTPANPIVKCQRPRVSRPSLFASGVARLLLLAPVGVGAVAHADEGGDEDGKSSKGSRDCVVHVFLLFAPESRCMARAARGGPDSFGS
jgi:hypothetical protein